MPFADNIRRLRESRGLTQRKVAEGTHINIRTIQNYELGKCYPRKESYVKRLADFFEVSMESLMSADDFYVVDAYKYGGLQAQHELRALLSSLNALFSGGKLTDEDKELVLKTMNDIYWDSKNIAHEKYGKDKNEL